MGNTRNLADNLADLTSASVGVATQSELAAVPGAPDEILNIQKEITINLTADANYFLDATENSYGRIIITDTGNVLTADKVLVLLPTEKHVEIHNETAFNLTVQTTTPTQAIEVTSGFMRALYVDGVDVQNDTRFYEESRTYSLYEIQDLFMTGSSYSFGSDANALISDTGSSGFVIMKDPSTLLTAPRTVFFGTEKNMDMRLRNDTAFDITFAFQSGGASIVVPVGATVHARLGDSSSALETYGITSQQNWATSTVGGIVKARFDGTNLYLTFDGTDA